MYIIFTNSLPIMATTVKPFIKKDTMKKDGTYPIKLRITHNSKTNYLATNLYASKSDLKKDFTIKSVTLNDQANDLAKQVRAIISQMGFSASNYSIDTLVNLIKKNLKVEPIEEFKLDVYKYIENYIENKPIGTRQMYQSLIRKIKLFTLQEDSLDINVITSKWVAAFAAFTNKPHKLDKKVLRVTHVYVKCLKTIHNKAKIDHNFEDEGIINIPFSPFSKITLLPSETPDKRSIPLSEIKKLIALPLKGKEELARDVFVLSFLLAGINTADMYSCTQIIDNRIVYNRQKTKARREDKALIHVLICDAAKPLMQKYADPEGKRIFNFYHKYANYTNFNQNMTKAMIKIGENKEYELSLPGNLTAYVARHSFATIAANDCNIIINNVHKALNHVDKDMKITDTYIRKDWSKIDEVILAVEKLVYSGK